MDQFDSAPGADGAASNFGEVDDPELARAIEASYASQTDVGMTSAEDEQFAEALRQSALEEEQRKKKDLGLSEEDEVMPEAVGRGLPSASSAAPHMPEANPHAEGLDERRIDMAQAAQSSVRLAQYRQRDGASAVIADATSAASTRPPLGGEWPGPSDSATSAEDDFAALDELNGHGARPGMDVDTIAAAAVAEQAEMSDRELAMAIEASYSAQTEHGQAANEDDLMAQALRMSKMEEETRERGALRESQEQELQESIMMDQMREEEQKRRRIEDEQLQRLETERQEEESIKKDEDERRRKEEEDQKKSRIPDEPPAGESGRVDFMIRMPDGKRVRRAFRGSETVGQVYDYVDVECSEAVASKGRYRLATSMPRAIYEDRGVTLADAGFKGQCALMIEAVQA